MTKLYTYTNTNLNENYRFTLTQCTYRKSYTCTTLVETRYLFDMYHMLLTHVLTLILSSQIFHPFILDFFVICSSSLLSCSQFLNANKMYAKLAFSGVASLPPMKQATLVLMLLLQFISQFLESFLFFERKNLETNLLLPL